MRQLCSHWRIVVVPCDRNARITSARSSPFGADDNWHEGRWSVACICGVVSRFHIETERRHAEPKPTTHIPAPHILRSRPIGWRPIHAAEAEERVTGRIAREAIDLDPARVPTAATNDVWSDATKKIACIGNDMSVSDRIRPPPPTAANAVCVPVFMSWACPLKWPSSQIPLPRSTGNATLIPPS